MKILVLKILDQQTKIFMVRWIIFFQKFWSSENFGPFANVVKNRLVVPVGVYIDRFLVLHNLIYSLANL